MQPTRRLALALLALTLAAPFTHAASPGPQPVAIAPVAPAPQDAPYAPGVIQLTVDLTDTTHRVVNVDETIPAASGTLTLYYPRWIPGTHSPTGPISKTAGFVFSDAATHAPLTWRRDPVDVFAFHVDVPRSTSSVRVVFQFLEPIRREEGRPSASDNLIDLAWNSVLLYPAGHFARQIQFQPTLRLPAADWHYATALTTEKLDGALVRFAPTPLNTLVDSPVFAGTHYQRVDLSTGPDNPVFLNLFGDTDEAIAISPEQIALHRNLTVQAQKLYASHHYSHYEFLFLLSDKVGGVGLEHHQSSENGEPARYLHDWPGTVLNRDLLAHEYTHSWDGKFRRPADLWTPDFNYVPMQDSLLWVYEGMTQYWGNVLTARAGLRSAADTRDLLAMTAAGFAISPGRTWRPLEDTTNQPSISQRQPVSWSSWQRPEDYYQESMLIWLDADTLIRSLSNGKRSLNDFARTFFGVDSPSFVTETYTFDDVVAALNAVQPYDWAGFLRKRVYDLAPTVPTDGFTRGGYRLVYSDNEPAWRAAAVARSAAQGTGFSTSLGLAVTPDGTVANVFWDSPAFKAGIIPGMSIVAVNDTAFATPVLRQAILDAEHSAAPIRLTVRRDDAVRTLSLDYHGGLRIPSLERIPNTPDLLDDILAPLP
jgi:predicted metalloprotease with PDZ domain